MIGRVVSTKMKNTVTVLVERIAKHPLYKKTYVQSKKYLVDVTMAVKDGDMVDIVKVRPVSKNKHWKVLKVVGKNLTEIMEEKLKAAAEKTIAEVMPESFSVQASEDEKKEGVVDNSVEKPKLKKKERTKVSKK